MNIPNDENGDILRKMIKRGDDLSKSRQIDFHFAFPEEQQANNFAQQVRLTSGLACEAARYEERDMWQATVTRDMMPSHREITELENSLDQIARSYGGEADGWGSERMERILQRTSDGDKRTAS